MNNLENNKQIQSQPTPFIFQRGNAGTPPATNHLLTETGDSLTAENSDNLTTE